MKTKPLATMACALSILQAGCGGGGGPADPLVAQCVGLRTNSASKAAIMSATWVWGRDGAMDYCQVKAMAGSQTQFELRLPRAWSRRYLHVGGGGFDGRIPNLDADYIGAMTALSRGYAVVGGNGGHVGQATAHAGAQADASWALGNPSAVADFAYGAIGTVDDAADEIIKAYYGGAPEHSYFSGCSSGGREALAAAVFYPHRYDGVVAGAPAGTTLSGTIAVRARIFQHLDAHPAAFLDSRHIALLARAELEACDALDGASDGLISNPAACRFDPAVLRCESGPGASCLTDAQIQTVHAIRDDLRLSDGSLVFSGYGLGAEDQNPSENGWQFTFMGAADGYMPSQADAYIYLNGYLRNFVFSNPGYLLSNFSLERDFPVVKEAMRREQLDIDPAALRPFLAEGRKLIFWNGVSDPEVSVNQTIRFYESVLSASGAVGVANSNLSTRLFALPSVQHCGQGPGADGFDMVGAVANWAERQAPPEGLLAYKSDDTGAPVRGAQALSRPLCAYPQYPRYKGSGDVRLAASHVCSAP